MLAQLAKKCLASKEYNCHGQPSCYSSNTVTVNVGDLGNAIALAIQQATSNSGGSQQSAASTLPASHQRTQSGHVNQGETAESSGSGYSNSSGYVTGMIRNHTSNS